MTLVVIAAAWLAVGFGAALAASGPVTRFVSDMRSVRSEERGWSVFWLAVIMLLGPLSLVLLALALPVRALGKRVDKHRAGQA